jgi:hypothetical protein
MLPKRISVKIFASNPDALNLEAVAPVFQRWIQQKRVEGVLIDVADYRHVPEGPGILLIAHEGDYAVNEFDGRPGVQYMVKIHEEASLPDLLRLAFRRALAAAQLLETESTLGGLRFNTGDLQINFVDRLNVPNTEASFNALIAAVAPLLPAGSITWAQQDPREFLSLNITLDGTVTPADLLACLGTAVTA